MSNCNEMKKWVTAGGTTIYRVLPGRSNVFLVSGGGKNMLVDTSPANRWGALCRRLKQLNINRLDYLVLTHSHFDHAANASKVRETFGAKVLVHESEEVVLSAGENVMIKGSNAFSMILVNLFAKSLLRRRKYEPCAADLIVNSSFSFPGEGLRIYLVHTPGHTHGSVSLIVDDEIALVGDAMFGVFPWSVLPPYAENVDLLRESWETLLATGCNLFLPSHGSSRTRAQLERRK